MAQFGLLLRRSQQESPEAVHTPMIASPIQLYLTISS
jgi:hypothetical protein